MQVNPERIAKGMYWDRAWSLVEGCSYVSPGCDHCWSAAQAHMRAGQKNEKIRARYEGLTTEDGRWNGKIRLLTENLDLPLRIKKPTVWAVWNDLFHELVPYDFIFNIIKIIRGTPQHIYLILTKRPEKMQDFFEKLDMVLPNLYLGTTAENQEQANKRIPVLLQIPAAVRFISVEPMLSHIDLTNVKMDQHRRMNLLEGCGVNTKAVTQSIPNTFCNPINWVICGGETGPGARPCHPDWVRSLRDQCQAVGVPFLFKQWGEWGERILGSEIVKNDPHCKKYPAIKLSINGKDDVNDDESEGYGAWMQRVGKKKAGRLLEGAEWNQFPEVSK